MLDDNHSLQKYLRLVRDAKSILFIAPEFFNFHTRIEEALREQGHRVFFVPDRPSKKAIVKILIRKARWLLASYLWRHYIHVLNQIPPDIDEVFIIKGEAITPQIMSWMKARFSGARFQLYLWDSLRVSRGPSALVGFMDRVWTFDYDDAQANPRFRLICNYYVEPAPWPSMPPRWDLTFIGSIHSDRLKVLARIKENLKPGLRFHRYLFFQSPLLYHFRRFFDPAFRKFPRGEMALKPKLGAEMEELTRSSVAVLDIHHPGQAGLSHRAIECLALGIKLVTTNEHIRHFPFYDERLIQIIDRRDPRVNPEFLREPARVEPPAAIKDLELSRWVKTIFTDGP